MKHNKDKAQRSESEGTSNVKNLEQIQEDEVGGQSSRATALIMASFGGACIVFAALWLMRSPAEEKTTPSDPLGQLVANSKSEAPKVSSEDLARDEVTFPAVLTDQDNPTTAMEAVRRRKAHVDAEAADEELPRAIWDGPPAAGDRLPVIPLPAQDVLAGTANAAVASGDTLRNLANHVGREQEGGDLAEPGSAGGYQLQVSSFKEKGEADAFAKVLRRRGHRAYVESAHVSGRGLWHRVRIGPFKYRRSAEIYRQDFEAKERVVGFIINPPQTRIKIGPSAEPEPAKGDDKSED